MRNGIIGSVILWLALVTSAVAEPRVALVIGNGAYPEAPLRNPPADAHLMAQSLRELGFDVTELTDIGQTAMKEAIVEFGAKLERGGTETVGLFYYSGHGIQLNGANYLVPVDASISREAEAEVYGVNADWVMTQLKYARNALNIVILDACRNNPFVRSFRDGQVGLARMQAPRGTMIAYSTSPGSVAADGTGANSPYTRALAEVIQQPGVALSDVFIEVRVRVMDATSDQQVPWEEGGLTAKFYFDPGDGSGETTVTVPIEVSPDAVFWRSIETSSNPAEYTAFLEQFPNSPFASLARLRLDQLSGAGPVISNVPPPQNISLVPSNETLYALVDAPVYGAPDASTTRISTIPGGDVVATTARVSGTNWVQVALANGGSGYIISDFLSTANPTLSSNDGGGGGSDGGNTSSIARCTQFETVQHINGC